MSIMETSTASYISVANEILSVTGFMEELSGLVQLMSSFTVQVLGKKSTILLFKGS